MTRRERLERWAELLSREPTRRLSTLAGTEYQPTVTRDGMRSLGSPISVAFGDPVLRVEGLTDDTYGEAKRFFELSDWQLHDIVCYCHHNASMTAEAAARRVRATIGGPGFTACGSAVGSLLGDGIDLLGPGIADGDSPRLHLLGNLAHKIDVEAS
jgi:hypothetical protein